jgi:hypothetical protein
MATARVTPVGARLQDGFSSKIAFAADANVSFWERTVTPPGVDGGDAIDTSTMHNVTWRTMASRALKTLTDSSITAAYDPQVFDQIVALINVEGLITVHFPNGDTLDFYGFLKSFTPGELTEGEMPEAEITIVCTNYNPLTAMESSPTLTQTATDSF